MHQCSVKKEENR